MNASVVDESAPAVEVRGLGRSYGPTVALEDVSLSIEQGELVSLLGASGSGKSTLLRLIAGFDTPTSGELLLGGRNAVNLSPAARDVGMVFQNYALFPHMTVRANIEYGLRMRRWAKGDRSVRVEEMLDRMQLSSLGNRLPSELSGGQQQRVAIARALAFEPRLLLMDEPLGALDKALRDDMLQEIRRVHREFGTSILYVTHDREEALVLSDRIALMDQGHLKVCAPVKELYLRPPTSFVAKFISGSAILVPDAAGVLGIARSGANATVSIRGEQVELPLPEVGDAPLALAVRPTDLSLVAAGGAGSITGTVVEEVFLGTQSRVVCRLDEFDTALNVLVPAHEAAPYAAGDRVGIVPSTSSISVVAFDDAEIAA